jgi:PAS domain S-box-containing protein
LTLRKGLFLLVLLTMLPAAVMIVIIAQEQRGQVVERVKGQLSRTLNRLSAQQTTLIETTRQILISTATIPDAGSPDPARCSSFLIAHEKSLESRDGWEGFGGFVRIGTDGKVDCASVDIRRGIDLSDRGYFKDVMATHEFAMSDFVMSRGKERIPILILGTPVFDEAGKTKRVLVVGVPTSWLNSFLAGQSVPEGSAVTMIDRKGAVFARFPGDRPKVPESADDHPFIRTVLDTDGEVRETIDFDGSPVLVGHRTIPKTTVRIALAIPLNPVLAEANALFYWNLFAFSVLLFVAVGAAWIAGHFLIVRKVDKLAWTAGAIEGGEMDARTGLSHDTTEFGRLARAFDDMAVEVERRVGERTEALEEEIAERISIENKLRQAQDDLEVEVAKTSRELVNEVDRHGVTSETLRKLSRAVEQSPSMVFITDTDGTIEYVNPKFTELTGYSAEEAIGRNPRILKSAETSPEIYADLWRTILSGKGWRGELRDRKRDGTYFWVYATISPVRAADGAITHYVAMHEDITIRREAETTALVAKEQAEIANRAKSELLANMSHELRTPLNAIIGFSDAIRTGLFGPLGHDRYLEYAEDISHSAEHLRGLINDVLDVSAVEAGRLDLHEESLDIGKVAEQSLRLIRPRADVGGVRLNDTVEKGLPALHADERRVKQILLNLLSNAVKFTGDGGEVTLGARLDSGGDFIIEVSDTGIGMDSRELVKAMTEFGQVDGTLARRHEGTGLGLPLTKGLVELHQGILHIESVKDVGTTVTVRLPAERVLVGSG